MSDQVGTAFVKHFEDAITLEPQQEEPRLWVNGMTKNVPAGEEAFFERIGLVAATKQQGRHAKTRQFDTPHTRRQVEMFTYDHADFIDRADLRRMKVNPSSSYVKTFRNAFNRAKDDAFIAASIADAKVGKTGSGTAAFTAGNILGASADTGLSLDKVLNANQILDAGEWPRIDRFIATSALSRRQFMTEEVGSAQFFPGGSADFGDKRALQVGTISQYAGFNWIPSERLLLDHDGVTELDRSIMAWHKDAMGTATLSDIFVDIGPRRDLQLTNQIYVEMDIGVTRVAESGVVDLRCDEAPA